MRTVVLLLLGVHLANAEVDSFPEYTAVGMVDDIPFVYFDSNIKRMIPKTEWIKENEGADYWNRESQRESAYIPAFKNNIQIAMQRFNQSAGVHTLQLMYGCKLDDQTGAKDALVQFGYDGEDLISLDFKEMRYITPVQQGIPSVQKWNNDKGRMENDKHYFSSECIDWLKKYLDYGKSSLKKTVSPQVSLLQKYPSSPVLCHATGFYPSGVTITWMKNGREHHEDVDLGELLPNEDGTFQKTSSLRVTPDEWKKNQFSCVVEHQGKTKTEDEIRTIGGDSVPIGIIVGALAAVVLLILIGAAGYAVYKKKQGSDDGSNSSAQAVPQA
ncbi:hypothetical protein ABG768_012191 [Culter alburnus]|uniref:Ig-like domain-containing protein n=1 Tax=Culter alburnus TaxID=194366 RepID=A0AAW1Z969_CULAL